MAIHQFLCPTTFVNIDTTTTTLNTHEGGMWNVLGEMGILALAAADHRAILG